ncbi:hypothetical protein ES703_110160 [subsurface metagenome]
MTSFTARAAQHFLVIKAAKEFKKEIEQAGLDNLKILVDKGISIVATYLNGCSPQEKARYKKDLGALFQMGVTPDMLLEEITRQIPQLAPMMEGKEGYKQTEISKLEAFIRGE